MVLKLPRMTWGLLSLATLLVGMVVAVELRRSPSEPESAMTNGAKNRHFGFTADQVQAITIQQGNEILKLYRSSVEPPGWQMDIPQPTPVSVPAVDFLLSTLVNSQSERDFEVSTEQLSEYGLVEPAVILTVQLIDGKTQQVHLGDPDFQGESLYALIDPATLRSPSVKFI